MIIFGDLAMVGAHSTRMARGRCVEGQHAIVGCVVLMEAMDFVGVDWNASHFSLMPFLCVRSRERILGGRAVGRRQRKGTCRRASAAEKNCANVSLSGFL